MKQNNKNSNRAQFVLRFSCPNRIGIVYAVSGFLAELGCDITSSAQYNDPESRMFFMRVTFLCNNEALKADELKARFQALADRFEMQWILRDLAQIPKIMIMVSKFDHCLVDLLYRQSTGELPATIACIVSNHEQAGEIARREGIAFHHLPISKATKAQQEAKLLDLIKTAQVDLVVLARYMQIFSDDLCKALPCPAINIHHSFLPSFKGARPYHQAHAKGVKIIGATAHYVTPDLDEGPIIEQNVERVSHAQTAQQLVAAGRDTERRTLAKAVRLHCEDRILLNGNKTVVFD